MDKRNGRVGSEQWALLGSGAADAWSFKPHRVAQQVTLCVQTSLLST